MPISRSPGDIAVHNFEVAVLTALAQAGNVALQDTFCQWTIAFENSLGRPSYKAVKGLPQTRSAGTQ
jgi:hypothetical protein